MKPTVTASLLCLAALALSGCSGARSSAPPPAPTQPTTVTAMPTASPLATLQPPQAAAEQPSPAAAAPTPSPHSDGKTAQTLASTGKADDIPVKTGDLPSYTPEQPALVGIMLGDAQSKVRARFGKPAETYTLEGEKDAVQVDDYGGFSVGYNAGNAVLFVDVASPDLDPRLNGLRLGQKADAAQKALGKPDNVSPYVLSYETKTTVLKFDLDPRTKAILSIKLFNRQE